jgi:hypothetical protein
VYPLRAKSVVWVTERRDVLSGLFYLAAVLAYLRDAEAPGVRALRTRTWYWASLGLFAPALASKVSAVSLPVGLPILDVYPLRRLGRVRWRWLEF